MSAALFTWFLYFYLHFVSVLFLSSFLARNLTNWSREVFMTLPQSVHFSQFDFLLATALIAGGSRLMPHATCLMPHALCLMPYGLWIMPYAMSRNYELLLALGFLVASARSDNFCDFPAPKQKRHTHTVNNNNNEERQQQQQGEEAGLKSVDVVFH